MHSISALGCNQPATSSQGGAPKTSWRDTIHAHPYASAMVAIAAGIAVAAGVMWRLHVFQYESTDDAFVDARTVAVCESEGVGVQDARARSGRDSALKKRSFKFSRLI
jgi:hypothetical protein